MTRKIIIRLRPADLRDNPGLLDLVRQLLGKSITTLEDVEILIQGTDQFQPVAEPLLGERVVESSLCALDQNLEIALKAATDKETGPESRPSAESVMEGVERESERFVGMLVLRGVKIVARIVEFSLKVGGGLRI
ncbi:MAG: hypothetical protein NTV21_14515 [Planctomycetota bacterium]|nr:hypothetical protein [Planctomycetota bacterium]